MSLQVKLTKFLYQTPCGRVALKAITRPGLTKAAGAFLSTSASKPLIKPFIRSNNIDMTQFAGEPYASYNDFFSRPIRPGARPIDTDLESLVSPADSKCSVYPISPDGHFLIKNTSYTLTSLLRDDSLAKRYVGGYCIVCRLCVDDYHRYCFPADGTLGKAHRINGVFHTVSPIANDVYPIYKENTREYVELATEKFGRLILMEVGALLVGRIVNHPCQPTPCQPTPCQPTPCQPTPCQPTPCQGDQCGAYKCGGNQDNYHLDCDALAPTVSKGQEKGYFQFGGSTVIMLAEPDTIVPRQDLCDASKRGIETPVRYGERLALSAAANIVQ